MTPAPVGSIYKIFFAKRIGPEFHPECLLRHVLNKFYYSKNLAKKREFHEPQFCPQSNFRSQKGQKFLKASTEHFHFQCEIRTLDFKLESQSCGQSCEHFYLVNYGLES